VTTLAFDNFNRADENPLASPYAVPGSSGFGGVKLLTNMAAAVTASTDSWVYRTDVTSPNDQISTVKVGALSGSAFDAGPVVRMSSTGANGYQLNYNDGANFYIFKVVSGGFSLLASIGGTLAVGDTMTLKVVGNVLTALKNGAAIGSGLTFTDSSSPITTGNIGFGIFGGTERVDEFTAEDTSSGMAGAAIANATLTGTLAGPQTLAGAASAVATVTAKLQPDSGDLFVVGDVGSYSYLGGQNAVGGTVSTGAAKTLAGDVAVQASASAALQLLKGLAAAASGSASSTADLNKAVALAVAAAAQAGATGQIALTVPLAGTAAGVGSGSGALGLSKLLAGASAGQTSVSGDLSNSSGVTLAGNAAGLVGASGDLTLSITLLGAALGQASVSAGMAHDVPLAGSAAGLAAGSGALATSSGLSGAAAVVTSANGQLALSIALTGQALGQAGASASLNGLVSIGGAAAAAAGVAGTLMLSVPLSGVAQQIASAGGGLVVTVLLGGNAQGLVSANGAFAGEVLLTGAAGVQATATAVLSSYGAYTNVENALRARRAPRRFVARPASAYHVY